jgi:hypothetical protein
MGDSAGFGDAVEQWLVTGTDVRRLAVPTRTFLVPGLGPLLVIALLGWSDSLTLLTVEPGLGTGAKHSNVRLAMRDDLGGFPPFRHGGGGGGGPFGRMIFNTTFADPIPGRSARRAPVRGADDERVHAHRRRPAAAARHHRAGRGGAVTVPPRRPCSATVVNDPS